MAEETHKMGIKIYAGYRVQQGDFHMPFGLFFFIKKFYQSTI